MTGLETLLEKLTAVLQDVDPGFGRILTEQGRWSSEEQASEQGGITVDGAGLIDDATKQGQRRIRFWTLEGHSEPSALTTGSRQVRHVVICRAFYAMPQEAELRAAASAALGRLIQHDTELVELSLGDGHMGYLGDVPRMTGPVQNAALGGENGVPGHTVELQVTVYEEVED